MRCDAQSCTVAATGGVLVRATGALEEDWSSGQQATTGHQTHRERERFFGGCSDPASHPPERWHLWIDQTGVCELSSLCNPCIVFHVKDAMCAGDTENTGCVKRTSQPCCITPAEDSLILNWAKTRRYKIRNHHRLCLFIIRAIYLQ